MTAVVAVVGVVAEETGAAGALDTGAWATAGLRVTELEATVEGGVFGARAILALPWDSGDITEPVPSPLWATRA